MSSELSIELLENDAGSVLLLAKTWESFAAGCNHSFFLSGFWIKNWLAALPNEIDISLILISRSDDPVAMVWAVQKENVRHRVVRSKALILNESGRNDLDALTIEYNGLLSKDGEADAATRTLLEWFGEHERSFDELVISGVDKEVFATFARHAATVGLDVRVVTQLPSPYVDLDRVRASEVGYLGLLSGNSRSQIRRSLRLYASAAPVRLSVAETPSDAEAYLMRLVELHQRYWVAKGEKGAFGNETLRGFHLKLIREGVSDGVVQLVKVEAGGSDIGYLYNFLHNGRVYNYQSGFARHDDNRLKPGLVSHALAIQYNSNVGHLRYDFLAGTGRYKRSLATDEDELFWCVFQRPKLAFRTERAFRMVKRQFKAR